MEDFVLLFRRPGPGNNEVAAAETQVNPDRWNEWFGSIAADGRLLDMNICLDTPVKVLKANGIITDGPFVEIKERLIGFIVISAESLDEAITIAHGCPILDIKGSVEVRAFEQLKIPGAKPVSRQA